MENSESQVFIDVVQPRSLSDDDIFDLSEVMQDMWAESIGEFIQCQDCGFIHSKRDVFGNYPKNLYNLTVRKLLGDFEVDTLSCQKCSGKVNFIYGFNHISKIRERLMQTRKAFLVLARNKGGEIVGFEDAYIDSLQNIFTREYSFHYGQIGIEEFSRRVNDILGSIPKEFVAISDIGLRPGYQTFQNTFAVLNKIASVMDDQYDDIPGCTEVHEGDGLHRLSLAMGSRSLGIRKDPVLGSQIRNTRPEYRSDIMVCSNVTSAYRRYFSGTTRDLVKLMARSEREKKSAGAL